MSDFYSLTLPVIRHNWLGGGSPLHVGPGAPIVLLRAVEKLARYFKRELGFDFVQFEAAETPGAPDFVPYEAYLFHELARDKLTENQPAPQRVVGACCFRWREWEGREPGWSLDWVWMHPYFRRRGHLNGAWPSFQKRYGHEFHIAPPLSIEMQAFINAVRQK
ncbi:hypothetical protein ACI2UK_27030 [Ralstonia nicotianae]|uniref:hypothetical protein n=1 Tax=Ralstonia pseudosolanacearum TaxID=1310165 RepID=UPI0020067233|nr:hypothetical protein [Ralstonia pseudosolanacearum]MCK4120398.1 hypothetical protein [Ralstonia pseudosolanacearum]